MILKRRVALGGVQLDSLDDRIIITSIDPAAGKDEINAVDMAGRDGQRPVRQKRKTLDVTVKFALKIRNDDMEAREELLEVVNGWSVNGGWLTIGSRPNRRLMVMLAQAPGSGDMFSWSNEFTLVFRAFSVPYWEDTDATSVSSATANSGTITLDVPGNAGTVADVTVENKSGKEIKNLKVKVGDSEFTFETLGLGGTSKLVINHVQTKDKFFLQAKIGSTSVLKYRQAGSADDFNVSPGNNTITFTADRAVKVTVSTRGRYV